jgi:hypothetical protein
VTSKNIPSRDIPNRPHMAIYLRENEVEVVEIDFAS